MTASPSPEIVPALDESRPEVGPNLASDQDFCREVSESIYKDSFYPYLLQQQRFWSIWDKIDDGWRVRCDFNDLDISLTDATKQNRAADGKGGNAGMISQVDGYSARVQPAALFKQIKTKTDMHCSIAWADGLPVRARVPETKYEHPLYNPTQQSVDAANEMLRQCSREIELEHRDRAGRGSWAKYGFAFAAVDFKYELEDAPMAFRLPMDQREAMMLIQAEMPRFGGQHPQYAQAPDGSQMAIWMQRTVKTMRTEFVPLRHDDVFCDLTLKGDLQHQPCPIMREHVTRFDLWGNDYDPEKNPFGWLNVQMALSDSQNHYTLSAQDEGPLRAELLKKWGMGDSGMIKQRNAIKQRWTAYPMLAISKGKDGKLHLDTGEGVDCPMCDGRKTVEAMGADGVVAHPECPQCLGRGRIFVKPERYVVQMFGLLTNGASSATVLRIQRNPTAHDMVPILYGRMLTEDNAGAIPMSLSEASIPAHIQLTTAHNQFLDAKNYLINRPHLVPEGSPAKRLDLNRAGMNVEYDGPPGSIYPMPTSAVDVTQNLPGYMSMQENEVQQIHGMSDQLLGMVSPGRRAATEIQTAFDAAKLPITVEIDSYNRQILAAWAQFHLWNIEAWADRDWIQSKTGRSTFGKVELFSSVADEFMKKQALIQNYRYMLELAGKGGPIDAAYVAQQLAKACGLPDPQKIASDGGVQKAQADGMKIVTKILGEGKFSPPMPDDPDDIYVPIFQEALRDEYWLLHTPETMPLLFQRLQMQQMQQQQKMMQQIQIQIQQQALLNPPQEGGGGNPPKRPGATPENKTQASQQMAGAQQG